MADMMRNHHNSIQDDKEPPDPITRLQATQRVLSRNNCRVNENHQRILGTKLTNKDVEGALHLSANHKAPGLNGISYEVWKTVHSRFTNAAAHNTRSFNIVETLRMARVFTSPGRVIPVT
ncbi:hypothetical protein EV361DRAFT_978397 [Lentinula raphanica]|nr:hypothetical protein EV361DRAFT_978397 [Lentinula raphanica]